MRLTVDNAPSHFLNLVCTLTGAEFTECKTRVIGDTRVDRIHSDMTTGIQVSQAFTLHLIEQGKDAEGEPIHDMRVTFNRTVRLPWQQGNRTEIVSTTISGPATLDLDQLGLLIEFCIDRMLEQADTLRTAVTEVAYV
jgi:hypothetical protein